jgi:hypothetical protein
LHFHKHKHWGKKTYKALEYEDRLDPHFKLSLPTYIKNPKKKETNIIPLEVLSRVF